MGKPRPTPDEKLQEILSRVVRKGACLEWTGTFYKNKKGNKSYPCIHFHGDNWRGNRLVWELTVGKIPNGICVLHSCDNMSCINIEHLSLGTYAENNRQIKERGRNYWLNKNHCRSGHPYNEENLVFTNRGIRHCRICRDIKRAQAELRRKAKNKARQALAHEEDK